MIRHTGRHVLGFPLVVTHQGLLFSLSRQDLGHTIPIGLADASFRCHGLRKFLMGPLQLLILGLQIRNLSHQGLDARFVVHHAPGTITDVFQVSLPPRASGAPRML